MLLKLIAALNAKENRYEAATKVAQYFNALYLVVFIVDSEINVLLPAPGFPQTLPNGPLWKQFLDRVTETGCYKDALPYLDNHTLLKSIGIAGPEGSVAVLLGGEPSLTDIEPLKQILPILITLFKQDQELITAKTLTAIAESAAAKAEKLTNTIDVIRLHLREALVKQENDKHNIEVLMKKKDEFMNIASHELKTPITSMKAYLQILERQNEASATNAATGFITKANKQADKLIGLVNDLLDVSKIQAGQMVYNFVPFDVYEIITEAVAQIQPTSASHQIITKNIAHVNINGDKPRLEQVVSNLITNAIKYSPNADKVIVELVDNSNNVIINVTDFGIGIADEELPYLFDRFFRVADISSSFSGLGLGLYISSEIIKRHQGKMGVKSELGKGSSFWFTIPK